ncbi:MAG: TonB-dependent receptor [Sphingomonadaceae bacterium]
MKLNLASASTLAISLVLGFNASVAFGQSAPAAAADEGEIVVTAQKRSQSLQDVSAAVSAVTADSLVNQKISNLEDLQTIIPSVNIGNDFNQAKLFIRGVGANTSTTGSSTGVALHVDGAYVARAEAQLTSLFDLERVEVLRGPQGSLYGRNAVGGSINLITAKPTKDLSGYVRGTYGNYNQIVIEAALNLPLSDAIRIRLASKTEDRDGFGRNPNTGTPVDNLKRRSLRGHVEVQSGIVDVLLTGEYFTQNDNSGAIKYLEPAFPGVARLAPIGIGGFATNPRDLASDVPPSVRTNSYSFTGTFKVDVSEHLTLTNIANYRDFRTALIQDLDASQIVNSRATTGQVSTVQRRQINSKQYSNEFQLGYTSDAIKGVLGFYYFNERQRPRDLVGDFPNGDRQLLTSLRANVVGLDGAAPSPALIGSISLRQALDNCGNQAAPVDGTIAPQRVCLNSDLGTETYAAFGQVNFDLGVIAGLDNVSVKLGGRYSSEKVTSRNPSIIFAGNGAGPIFVTTSAATFRQRTFKDFTPEFGAQWQPSRDVLLYYTYAEGFKAGSGENAAGSTIIVNPETVKNHEIGIKSQFLDRKLTLNLAAYTYTLLGLQINRTIAGGPAGFLTQFQNAARTTAQGVEVELAARPTPALRLSGAVSYTRSRYRDFVTLDPLNPVNVTGGAPYNPVTNPVVTAFGGPCGTSLTTNLGPCSIQLAGNQTRNSPDWAYNARAEWDLPIIAESVGTLTLSGDVGGKSNVFFTEFARAREGTPGYALTDFALRFQSPSKHFSAQAWVKNTFDVFRRSSTFALSTGRIIGVTYLPPRTYGLTIGYTF